MGIEHDLGLGDGEVKFSNKVTFEKSEILFKFDHLPWHVLKVTLVVENRQGDYIQNNR